MSTNLPPADITLTPDAEPRAYPIAVEPLTSFYAAPPEGGSGPGGSSDGSSSGGGCKCGPDVTKWFVQQLKIIHAFAERHFNVYVYPDAALRTLVAKLRFENAGLKLKGCPACKKCIRTVTLCGTCIDVTELGNIAYGYAVGRKCGMALMGGFYAEVKNGRGFDKYEDVMATIMGVYLRTAWDGSQRGLRRVLAARPEKMYGGILITHIDDIVSSTHGFGFELYVKGRVWYLDKWNLRHRKFGDWEAYIRKAFDLLDRPGGLLDYLDGKSDAGCGACGKVVSPKRITIAPDGTPSVNGKPL